MTVIRNGTLGRCSVLGLATQGTPQTAQQDEEVNFCFQSVCGSGEQHRNRIWRVETFRIRRQLRRSATGKGRQQAKTEAVLRLVGTSRQQVHRFGCNKPLIRTSFTVRNPLGEKNQVAEGEWESGAGGTCESGETEQKWGAWGYSETAPLVDGYNHSSCF